METSAPAVTSVDVMLEGYRTYLVSERALLPSTVGIYLWNARLFMSVACENDPTRLGSLTVAEVARFVSTVAECRRASSVNTIVVSVRSLLRWCHATGVIATPMAQATPWLARGRVSTLPRMVTPGAVGLLLSSFDRSTLIGARDYAMVTVFARMGLRVGELVAVEVDDIDWRRGELSVRSKGGWRDPLPVPVDVGEAITAYLSARGRDDTFREVFLRVRAPWGPLTPTAVRAVVRRGCARVGLPDLCTHRLRHAVAGDLLAQGADLVEIGQLLRHHDLATTAIYARVDVASLAPVAQPWPRSAS